MFAFAIHYCGMVAVVVVVVVVVGWIIVSNTIDKFFVVLSHSFYFTFIGARGESFSEGGKCPSENALACFLLSFSHYPSSSCMLICYCCKLEVVHSSYSSSCFRTIAHIQFS